MKEEIAKAWISALRSGEYQQGKERLRVGDKFCCLGVLCEISKLGKWEKQGKQQDYAGARFELPDLVIDWAGMKTSQGVILSTGQKLDYQNDTGKSFNEIADLIEEHWKEI